MEVKNTLANSSYTEKYKMTMQVGEGQFDEFVANLGLEEIEEKNELEYIKEDYFEGEVLDGGGIFYRISGQKRNIWYPFFSVSFIFKHKEERDRQRKKRRIILCVFYFLHCCC